MAEKRPLVNYGGSLKEVLSSDRLSVPQIVIPVYCLPGTSITYTNMTAAVSWFNNSSNSRPAFTIDLTNCTEFRVSVLMNATIGAASAKICARYIASYSATAASYSQLGTGSTEVYASIGTGTASSISDGAWTTITAAARTTVVVGCFGLDGDGVIDPTIGNVFFYAR